MQEYMQMIDCLLSKETSFTIEVHLRSNFLKVNTCILNQSEAIEPEMTVQSAKTEGGILIFLCHFKHVQVMISILTWYELSQNRTMLQSKQLLSVCPFVGLCTYEDFRFAYSHLSSLLCLWLKGRSTASITQQICCPFHQAVVLIVLYFDEFEFRKIQELSSKLTLYSCFL